jgi:hypothetical protein
VSVALREVSREVFLFDLEAGDEDEVFASLVTTDRSAGSCDTYAIVKFEVHDDSSLSSADLVWKSGVCRSVIDSRYGWPDFTGRLAFDGSSLLMSTGMSSMNMITETYPEPMMTGFEPTLEEELLKNDLFSRVLRINPTTGQARAIASGFRSPAGITVRTASDGERQIWVSEHGSRGGDELNFIVEGRNYGWPYVSLGASYGMSNDPTVATQFLSHEGFRAPNYSWTPSIAPSQLHSLELDGFRNLGWPSGTLVLGTLKDKSLRFLSLNDDGFVRKDERVFLNHRIRDIDESGGNLILSTDDGMLLLIAQHNASQSNVGMYPPLDDNNPFELVILKEIAVLSDKVIDLFTN